MLDSFRYRALSPPHEFRRKSPEPTPDPGPLPRRGIGSRWAQPGAAITREAATTATPPIRLAPVRLAPVRLAIVGLGKIARDQHLPAIQANPAFTLAAIASRNAALNGVPNFPTIEALLASGPLIDAVALCTPPQGRHIQARAALLAGKHVLLEKPPGATIAEIATLTAAAAQTGRTLFATWHSRFAPAVEPARDLLARHPPHAVQIEWKEDVRHWHPGQDWIWQPGGLGVFDPGINALSILTRIMPSPLFLTAADLFFPANRAAPIAAHLTFTDSTNTPVTAEFDWRQTGPPSSRASWNIHLETAAGRSTLSGGGRTMTQDGRTLIDAPEAEYPNIYRRFAALIAESASDVDLAPLIHVADAFMLGRRHQVEPFHEAARGPSP